MVIHSSGLRTSSTSSIQLCVTKSLYFFGHYFSKWWTWICNQPNCLWGLYIQQSNRSHFLQLSTAWKRSPSSFSAMLRLQLVTVSLVGCERVSTGRHPCLCPLFCGL
jgi:hypothetical protein